MYNILMKLVLLGAPLNCADANELLSLIRPFDPDRLEMTRVIIAHTDSECFNEDAKADWRNGNTDHPHGLKVKIPTTLGANQMAQVTYRGIKYDTNRNRTQQTNKVDLTYRGVRQEKELTSVKWL